MAKITSSLSMGLGGEGLGLNTLSKDLDTAMIPRKDVKKRGG